MVSVINFDRFLMGYTLGAHILIVTLSISLSVIVSAAEFIGLRRLRQQKRENSECRYWGSSQHIS